MKISVHVGVSQVSNHYTFTLEELGLTQQEWENLSDYEKGALVEERVNDLPEQPYWVVNSYHEK